MLFKHTQAAWDYVLQHAAPKGPLAIAVHSNLALLHVQTRSAAAALTHTHAVLEVSCFTCLCSMMLCAHSLMIRVEQIIMLGMPLLSCCAWLCVKLMETPYLLKELVMILPLVHTHTRL